MVGEQPDGGPGRLRHLRRMTVSSFGGMMTDRTTAPTGLRVVLAEDNWPIALFMENMLRDLGCTVVATAGTVAEAESMAADQEAECAILDIDLGSGGRSYGAAERALARGMAVIFTTGYDVPADLPETLRNVPRLEKPIQPVHLKRALKEVASP